MAQIRQPLPVLLTLHSDELSTVWEVVAPFWSMYAERHGYTLTAEPCVQVGRAAQWRKLAAIEEQLAGGRSVLFVDADTFPVADAPDIRDDLRPGVGLATTVQPIDKTRVHVGCAFSFFTPDALPVLQLAQQQTNFINSTFSEESALAAALGLKVEGWHHKPPKNWPDETPGVQVIGWEWLRNQGNGQFTKKPARVWHAAGHQGRKLELIRRWLEEGRHIGQRRDFAKR